MSNEIVQHHDWLPTFLAAAGEPDIVEKLKKGHTVGDKTYTVHIDGYNLHDYITVYGTAICTQFLETFKQFPPRQEPATFTIDHAVRQLHEYLARD